MKLTLRNIHKEVLTNKKLPIIEKEKILKQFIKDHTGEKKKPRLEVDRVSLQIIRVYKRSLVSQIFYEKYKAKGGRIIPFFESSK